MSSDVAIKVENLSKCYQIYEHPRDRLRQFVFPRLQAVLGMHRQSYFREFWALRHVSFEIKKGATVGIMGRNGVGKSTLLQIICGTLRQTSGAVEIHGRIAALLELGSGFNPEFTGRENTYLNASLLGLTEHEVDARFAAIAAFADIGAFIDQPVKTYSSGMMVRLAFAVIAHVDAEILVIDEALSVGDVFFQQKCRRFLQEFQARGGTLLFVSHDSGAVTALCDSAILLSRDQKQAYQQGPSEEICRMYLAELYEERAASMAPRPLRDVEPAAAVARTYPGQTQTANLYHLSPFQSDSEAFGAGGAKIRDVWFQDDQGQKVHEVQGESAVCLCMRVEALVEVTAPAFGFMIKDRLGQYIFAESTNAPFRSHSLVLRPGEIVIVKFSFVMPILIQGEYALNVAVAQGDGHDHFQHHWIHDAILISSLKSRLVHGIGGVHGLAIEIQIESPNLDVNA